MPVIFHRAIRPEITHITQGSHIGLRFLPRYAACACWNWLGQSGVWPGILCEADGTICFPSHNWSQADLEEIRTQFLAGASRVVFKKDDDEWGWDDDN